MVEENLRLPAGPAAYFDSKGSPLNPYNRGYDSFVYGTLPIFTAKVVATVARQDGYDRTYRFGRALSGVFDLLTVWLVYRLARRFAGRRAALAAAALLAFCPLGIQLSHFWAVDTFLATFATATLYGCVRLAQGRSGPAADAATGVALGLAVGCKVTALALFAPVGIALLVLWSERRREIPAPPEGRTFLRVAGRGALVFLAAVVSIRAALPYAFDGLGLDPRYLRDLKNLAAISSSVAGFPPALQWAGRTILFPIRNFVLWGAGPFFGLTALAALVWSFLFAARRREFRALLPLSAYVLFVGLYHGLTLVKSIRYFYPAYPALAVLSGILLARLGRLGAARRLRWAAPATVLAGTFLCAVAFTAIYRRPHPRIEASRWIFTHVTPPARIGNEAWDDGQPMPMPGYDPAGYAGPVFELFHPDSVKKAEALLETLNKSDWIAVTSNRVYGNTTRIPDVFPLTRAYYRALFDGALGFERAAEFTSYPSLGPLVFDDDRAEEQFTVYDHPRVLLFRKSPDYSPQRARRILLASLTAPPPTMWDWEKWPRARRRVSAPIIPAHGPAVPSPSPAQTGAETDSSLAAAAIWYLALAAFGLAALPLAWMVFSRLADRGFGFARIVGLVLAAYGLNFAVARAGLANGRAAAFAAFAVLAAAGAAVFAWRRREILDFLSRNRRALWQSEAAFAIGFVLFLALRAFNPEITWGEKPMDFSILNILVRTRTLPASDPWFAGAPLGYYAFGQEIVALLTLVTGLSTRFTFNLAFGLLGGALLQGAFALARNWAGTLRAGVAGAAFVALAGNLAGLREWLAVRRPRNLPLDWHYFWATSRVVKDTINEYPLWSLLFADLHAHVLSMPLLLLVLAQALQLVRVHADPAALPRTRLLAASLLGFFGAAEALTNAWDAPLLAGLLLVTALAAGFAGAAPALVSAVRALAAFAVASAVALAASFPLWPPGGKPPAWGRNLEKGAAGLDVATVFGLFFLFAIAWWLAAAADRFDWKGSRRLLFVLGGVLLLALGAWRSADLFCLAGVLLFVSAFFFLAGNAGDRLAIGLVGGGFFLVLFAQRFYIYDRMNTFFKLYLAAWLLFAVGTAVLAFRPREARGAFARWPWPLKALAVLFAGMAFFTSVTVARGALTDARPTRRGDPIGPTLDGLRYLERSAPGEYRAVLWLRSLRGTPVVVEAQGPSYQDFGRISMLTGLPTVLGWDYHVQQRGNAPAEIARRKEAVAAIYTNPNADAVEDLLRRYHVAYVYVGPLERKTYPGPGLAKFAGARNLFQLAYENPEVRIYRVVGGDSEDVVLPRREELPTPVPSARGPADETEEPPILSETPASGRAPFAGLKEPRDAAVDERGRIWVADFGNSRLRLFGADGGYLGGWGGRGDGTYAFRELCGVATRGEDLFVADTWNGRVELFTQAGAWKAAAKDLYGPRGIAAAPDGAVWVTDTGNHRLVVYDSALAGPRMIGRKGAGQLEFDSPVGIAAAPDGRIVVCDTGNKRLQVLDQAGAFVRAIPIPGWSGPVEPHVEADDGGTLYVSDPTGGAVLVLDFEGRVRERRDTDDAGKKFVVPTGVALDRKNRILYVVNSGNNSISKVKLPVRKGD